MTRSFLLLLLATAALPAATVQEVLARMDQAAASFTGVTAAVSKVAHTEVINDNSEEAGSITLKKVKPREVAALIEFTKPDARTIGYRGKKAQIFYPKLNTVQEYNLSRYGDVLEFFSLIGFGTAGKELSAGYDVKLAGEETVAGKRALKLELTPKSSEKREKLKRVDMWVADGGAYPVQQRFLQPSGDYTMFTYTDVKLNVPVSDAAVQLKLPKGVKRETPQK